MERESRAGGETRDLQKTPLELNLIISWGYVLLYVAEEASFRHLLMVLLRGACLSWYVRGGGKRAGKTGVPGEGNCIYQLYTLGTNIRISFSHPCSSSFFLLSQTMVQFKDENICMEK